MAQCLFRMMSVALGVLVIALPASAQQRLHIAMELVPETTTPVPGGQMALALVSRPEPGWHGYWLNPGDVGLPLTVEWTIPGGATAGPLAFPMPHPLIIGGLMNHVYEGAFAHLVTLDIPAKARPGSTVPIRAEVDYLVCSADTCIPESQTLETELTVGDGGIDVDRKAMFERFRAAMPTHLGGDVRFATTGARDAQTIRLAVPLPPGTRLGEPHFFALTKDVVDYAAPQRFSRAGNELIVEIRATAMVERLEGVLALGTGRGFSLEATPGAVPETGASLTVSAVDRQSSGSTAPSTSELPTGLIAFGGALLGGLLLNVMPCVFPILSLKALSLARAGETEKAARAEALAYTAGAVLVVLALGGSLLMLRATGASVGWAFQLQDPRVILVLLVLVTGIALNLAGVFELQTPLWIGRLAANNKSSGFMTGALAAFIATPCTGPFMGAALGVALVLPWYAALAVFFGLGLGLAFPFLLLGLVPALRRGLPKPGAWMATFRCLLSVPMFLTALGLAWVLGRQTGVEGMTTGLAASLLGGIGLWWTGRRQFANRTWQWTPAISALLLALSSVTFLERAAGPADTPTVMPALEAEPFSEGRLEALRAEGRPVFAYFTADWCVTCKVNEKTAIETHAVANAFKRGNVAVLIGDWTNGDADLGRFIGRHNRAGVPLYLWYAAGVAKARVLPQLLTQSTLTRLPR